MNDGRQDRKFRIGPFGWIFYALLAALAIGGIWQGMHGERPAWENCRESMLEQIFTDRCTPRKGVLAPQQQTLQPAGPALPS